MSDDQNARDESLPVLAACSILAISPGHFYDWRSTGLFGPPPATAQAKLSERDAVEAATVKVLTTALGASYGRLAYRTVRDAVLSTVPPTAFEIVWVEQNRSATLVRTDEELAAAVRCEAPAVVVQPAREISRVLKAWQVEVGERTRSLGAVRRARRRRHATSA